MTRRTPGKRTGALKLAGSHRMVGDEQSQGQAGRLEVGHCLRQMNGRDLLDSLELDDQAIGDE